MGHHEYAITLDHYRARFGTSLRYIALQPNLCRRGEFEAVELLIGKWIIEYFD